MRTYINLRNTVLTIMIAASLVGCQTKAGTGALIGGAGGALVGGLIGSYSHQRAGEGALIGGAVGAIGGALVGNAMDENDKKEREASYTSKYDQNYDQYGNKKR
ncbi:MAG: glycine zipper 2TM domain-containing protein [Burkholderiales bacterium]|nr:glycine zipper 2TM domain-containing protein [Phycisphaerae bacterium]